MPKKNLLIKWRVVKESVGGILTEYPFRISNPQKENGKSELFPFSEPEYSSYYLSCCFYSLNPRQRREL
jgi:hypothetical protein